MNTPRRDALKYMPLRCSSPAFRNVILCLLPARTQNLAINRAFRDQKECKMTTAVPRKKNPKKPTCRTVSEPGRCYPRLPAQISMVSCRSEIEIDRCSNCHCREESRAEMNVSDKREGTGPEGAGGQLKGSSPNNLLLLCFQGGSVSAASK
jgi:hypothetical protein